MGSKKFEHDTFKSRFLIYVQRFLESKHNMNPEEDFKILSSEVLVKSIKKLNALMRDSNTM